MKTTFQQIKISDLKLSSSNPRGSISQAELAGLTDSIKAHGIIQPLAVRKVRDGYEIIAGHRRAAAAEAAGLKEVPCAVRADKGDLSMLQLVENTQRVDLMPYEIALGMRQAVKAGKIKQQQLAAQLGRSEAWVSKFMTIAKAIDKRMADLAKIRPRERDESAEDFEQRIGDGALSGPLGGSAVDPVYAYAQEYLNPKKAEASAPKKSAGDTKEEEQGDLLEKAELEVIAELKSLALSKLGLSTVDVVPNGKQGFKLALTFNTEGHMRAWINSHAK